MRVFAIVSALLVAVTGGCGGVDEPPEHQAEWREVLQNKRAAAEPGASADSKQVWADSVRAFVERHPGHSRAREVWIALRLEFADDLMRIGRTHKAAAFYRSVLHDDANNERALRGWDTAAARLTVEPARLRMVQPGMRAREVAAALGRPLPGWSRRVSRPAASFEAWYYRTPRGVAAVHFREGRVIAVDES